MKQHITIDQLNELSEKGKGRLQSWVYSDDRNKIEEFKEIKFETEGYFPLLSIGQMIEFLDWPELFIYKGSPPTYYMRKKYPDKNIQRWFVQDGDGEYAGEVYKGFSVCDALWEAVKNKLNK